MEDGQDLSTGGKEGISEGTGIGFLSILSNR